MRRYGVLVIVIGMLGSACAAPDPVLEPEPEIQPAQVAVVEDVASASMSDHADDGHHDDPGDHADDGHHDEDDGHHGESADAAHDGMADPADDQAGAEPAAEGEFDVEVDVVFSEFSIVAPSLAFSPGQTVRFHLGNQGELEHEFRLSNQHRIDEHIAAGHEDHGGGEDHHGTTGDVFVVLEPGSSKIVDVTFPDDVDSYTIVACLVPGHYEAGMSVPIEYK